MSSLPLQVSPESEIFRVLDEFLKGKDKVKATLYDIADDCSTESKRNYTLNHFIERIKIYNEEQFNYEIITIKLRGEI